MATVAMPERATRKGRSSKKAASRAPITVMLVDDHPLWRDTLRQVLERSRFATVVAEASDGIEAAARARQARPDVVVMDIQLPDKNGIEATRDLVADIPEAKVLVLASSDNRAQVLAAIEAGASGYLLKTAVSDEVRDAVRRVHIGELVFPPKLANVVLDELRHRHEEPSSAPEPAPPNTIHQEGDFWTIVFEGQVFRLKDARGAGYLATLLLNPGREFHTLDLVSGESGIALRGREDAGTVLDPHAKAAYRRRMQELEEEIAEAESWDDTGRATRARDELESIRDQLGAAVGLGGRDRRAASASERARVSVTLALRSTLAKIADYSPALSAHLAATITTGTYCSYTPDPRSPTTWV